MVIPPLHASLRAGCVYLLLFVASNLPGQCPEFTSSSLGSADCFNGSTPCDLCPGETFQLLAEGDALPDNGCVNWYYSPTPGFNPYAGEGTLIGCGEITAPPPAPCSTCPEILAIWIDACGSEQANEFMILSSGSGFNVNNMGVDFDPSNNGMSPFNEDINTNGGGCNWQVPSAGIISSMQSSGNCDNSNIIPAGPGTVIPPGVLVVIVTSSAATTSYNFDNLCAAGHTIYVMQNSCPRTIGAFSNSSSTGERTTTIVLNNCNCSHSITHDTDDPSLIGDGDYAYYDNGNVVYGNGGCANPTPPDVEPTPVDYPPATVDPVTFTVTAGLCNLGPYYVVGILAPLAPGCPEVFTDEFAFNVVCPDANAFFNGSPCTGNTISLEATGGTSYQWSGPDGFSSTEQNPTLGPLTPAQAGTYSVTVTNAAGCTDIAQVSVSIFPDVMVTVSPPNPSICEGESVLLVASGQGGGGGYTFSWSLPSGQDIGPSVLATEGGIYSVTVTDANGCSDVFSGTITELQLPVVSINPDPAGFCTGGEVELSATITGGAGGNQITWFDPANNPFNAPTFIANSPGIYSIIVTDIEGCSGSNVITVSEYPVPTVTLNSDPPTICVGASVVITATGNGGTGGYTYAWNTPGGPASGNPLSATTAGMYSVLLTDAVGCTAVDTLQLLSGTELIVSFNPDPATFCPGGSVILSAQVQGAQGGNLTYSWETPSGTAFGNPLNTALAGTYSVTVSEENGCTGNATINVLENANLGITFLDDSLSVCSGGQVTLQGDANGGDGNYMYTWQYPGGPTQGNTLVVSMPGTFVLQVSDGNGCMGMDSVIVSPGVGLPVSIQAGASAICPGGMTTLSITPSPDTAWTFLWTTPSGSSMGYPLTVNQTGTYHVSVTFGGGCTSTDSIIIDGLLPPIIEVLPVNPSICPGSMIPLSVNIIGGGPLVNYQWQTPSGPAGSMGIQASLAGTYTVTVTNDMGCTAISSTQVTLSPGLQISFPSPNISICSGSQIGLSPVIIPGIPPYQYTWNGPGGMSTSDTLYTGTPGVYSVTVTDAAGCSGVTNVTLSIGTSLDVTIIPSSPGFCPQESVVITALAPGGQSPLQYSWSTPGGSGTMANFNASQSGTYMVTVTDASGCSGNASTLVEAWPAPMVVISPDGAVVCAGQTVNLSASASGSTSPYSFSWSGPMGQSTGPMVSNANPGTYFITATDSRGCIGTAQTSVSLLSELQVSIDPVAPALCQGSSVTTTASVLGGTGPYTYVWESVAGIEMGNPVVISNPGLYSLMVTDALGCTGSLTFNVSLLSALDVTIQTVSTACGDTPYFAEAFVTMGSAPYSYVWQTPSGSGNLSMVQVTAPGTTSVTVTDQNGCTGTAMAVVASGSLVATMEVEEERCPGVADGRIILNTVSTGAFPLQVQLQGQPAQVVQSLPLNIDGLSAGSYVLTVSDANGCSTTLFPQIGLLFDPQVYFNPADHTIPRGTSIVLSPVSSFNPTSWSWSPPTGLSCIDCMAPTATPDVTQEYLLVVSDDNGCSAEASVLVMVISNTRVYIPTAFSPNEDGINDLFFVHAADEATLISQLQIYDRWGNSLYEILDAPVNDVQFGWNGKFRDKLLDPGVYVYTVHLIFPDGRERLYRGEVTLMR